MQGTTLPVLQRSGCFHTSMHHAAWCICMQTQPHTSPSHPRTCMYRRSAMDMAWAGPMPREADATCTHCSTEGTPSCSSAKTGHPRAAAPRARSTQTAGQSALKHQVKAPSSHKSLGSSAGFEHTEAPPDVHASLRRTNTEVCQHTSPPT